MIGTTEDPIASRGAPIIPPITGSMPEPRQSRSFQHQRRRSWSDRIDTCRSSRGAPALARMGRPEGEPKHRPRRNAKTRWPSGRHPSGTSLRVALAPRLARRHARRRNESCDAIALPLAPTASRPSDCSRCSIMGSRTPPAIDRYPSSSSLISIAACPDDNIPALAAPRVNPSAVENLSRQLAAEARAKTHRPADFHIVRRNQGLRPPAGVPHVATAPTPARYLWSQTEQYTQGGLADACVSIRVSCPTGHRLREWDRRTASHVTRIHRQLFAHRHARSRASTSARPRCPPAGAHGLLRARIATAAARALALRRGRSSRTSERISPSAAAARETDPLIIVGNGSELGPPQHRLAGPGVSFDAHATDALLRTRYQRARLLVFPANRRLRHRRRRGPGLRHARRRLPSGTAPSTPMIENTTGVFFGRSHARIARRRRTQMRRSWRPLRGLPRERRALSANPGLKKKCWTLSSARSLAQAHRPPVPIQARQAIRRTHGRSSHHPR